MVNVNQQVVRYTALVAGGVTVGAVTGYFICKKRLDSQYKQIADEEIASVKERYRRLYKDGEFSTPETTTEALGVSPEMEILDVPGKSDLRRGLERLGYSSSYGHETEEVEGRDSEVVEHTIFVEEKIVTHNIFDEDPPEDLGKPVLSPRDPKIPYLITVEEFMDNEMGHSQNTISYFETDEVLADERQQIIPDADVIVGVEHFDRFGEGSNDEDIVYVRNERLGMDFEITREDGSYSVDVLGLDADLLEDMSRPPRVRKMRNARDD